MDLERCAYLAASAQDVAGEDPRSGAVILYRATLRSSRTIWPVDRLTRLWLWMRTDGENLHGRGIWLSFKRGLYFESTMR
jgi:hypothetical protein